MKNSDKQTINNEELRRQKIKEAYQNFPKWKHYEINAVAPFLIDSDEERRKIVIMKLVGELNNFLQVKKSKLINYFTILSFYPSEFTKNLFVSEHRRGDGQYVYRGQFYSPMEIMKIVETECLEGYMDIFIEEEDKIER